MNVSEIVGASEYKKGYSRKRRFVRMMILIFGIASILLVVLTYYGHNAGNFVIRVADEANEYIVVTENYSDLQTTRLTKLSAGNVRNASDLTLTDLEIDNEYFKAIEGEGSFESKYFSYLAYSFYVVSKDITVGSARNLHYTIRCTESTKGMNQATRIMVVKQDKSQIVQGDIYKMTDIGIQSPVLESTKIPWRETEWLDNDTVCRGQISGLSTGQWTKFTVFIWLEGNDVNTTDAILGGKVKFDMVLSLRE